MGVFRGLSLYAVFESYIWLYRNSFIKVDKEGREMEEISDWKSCFFNKVEYSEYRSLVSLGKFIPRYFIYLLFDVTNEISSLISLSDLSL